MFMKKFLCIVPVMVCLAAPAFANDPPAHDDKHEKDKKSDKKKDAHEDEHGHGHGDKKDKDKKDHPH
jgi:hypothetical protein